MKRIATPKPGAAKKIKSAVPDEPNHAEAAASQDLVPMKRQWNIYNPITGKLLRTVTAKTTISMPMDPNCPCELNAELFYDAGLDPLTFGWPYSIESFTFSGAGGLYRDKEPRNSADIIESVFIQPYVLSNFLTPAVSAMERFSSDGCAETFDAVANCSHYAQLLGEYDGDSLKAARDFLKWERHAMINARKANHPKEYLGALRLYSKIMNACLVYSNQERVSRTPKPTQAAPQEHAKPVGRAPLSDAIIRDGAPKRVVEWLDNHRGENIASARKALGIVRKPTQLRQDVARLKLDPATKKAILELMK